MQDLPTAVSGVVWAKYLRNLVPVASVLVVEQDEE